MWIEKTRNGMRMVDRAKINGKVKRVSVPLSRDTPQGRKQAQEALLEKIAMEKANLTQKTVRELVDVYIEQKDVKATTELNIRYTFNAINEIFGDIQVRNLSAALIKRFLLETGKPMQTCNQYIKFLKSFLKWCFEFEYIQDDVAAKLNLFQEKSRRQDESEKYLEADELADVLNQLQGMSYYIAKFLSLTGMRVGEALALTLDDLDTHIHVTKSYSCHMVTTPKSPSSWRDVFIQPELRAMLDEYLRWRKLYQMSKGIRSNYLFFNLSGGMLATGTFSANLKNVKCAKNLHPHIFRHTHVALLAEQGVPLDTISRRLGHESSRITKEVYLHVTNKMKQQDDEKLEKVSIF